MNQQLYAALPVAGHAPYPRPCPECSGHGVTGDRYEMPAGAGRPILLVDVICPACGGCGNGDPDHADCPPAAHADPEEYGDGDQADDDSGAPRCYSCGSGRGWNAVQSIGSSADGSPESLVILRVPCGCSEDRLMIGTDPATLGVEAEWSPAEAGAAVAAALEPFAEGQEVIWTGLEHRFARRVRIVAARRGLRRIGQQPEDAPMFYDIADPTIKGTVYAIPGDQLEAVLEEEWPAAEAGAAVAAALEQLGAGPWSAPDYPPADGA